jgi:acyl-CoA synthetase (AMP-forming)/AMP-acid ligase II
MASGNFAADLLSRCPTARLIDAATGVVIDDVPAAVARAGGAFAALGLQPGDRVLIGCDLSPATAVAYLGAMWAGLVPVPLEGAVVAKDASSLIDATGARAVWAADAKFRVPGALCGLEDLAGPASAAVGRTDGDLAALMATSGSTGTPRFVRVTHGNLTANTDAIARSQNLAAGERAMLVLPLSYCFAASVLHSHLWMNGDVVFDRRFMFPDKVLKAMAEHGCTTFAGVPSVYRLLLTRSNFGKIAIPSLRRLLQAGGPLAPDAVRAVREKVPDVDFFVMYGQTEATARITCLDPKELDRRPGSVGRPLDSLTLRIDPAGEIYVRGRSICDGYWNDPAATAERFPNGELRTGDLGHLDADGFLWIDGRLSEFAKVRGVRLAFGAVEAHVAAVAGVDAVAACAVPHPDAGEALALFVVPKPGAGSDLAKTILAALPPAWTCAGVRVVDALPTTANGKLARGHLPRLFVPAETDAQRGDASPGTAGILPAEALTPPRDVLEAGSASAGRMPAVPGGEPEATPRAQPCPT